MPQTAEVLAGVASVVEGRNGEPLGMWALSEGGAVTPTREETLQAEVESLTWIKAINAIRALKSKP